MANGSNDELTKNNCTKQDALFQYCGLVNMKGFYLLYIMVELLSDIPFEVQKKNALVRRANKLIEWLKRPEYATYTDENSITHVIQLIDLIVWALEKSLPIEEWRLFRESLMAARNVLVDIVETEQEEIDNYYKAIPMIETTLLSYIQYIQTKTPLS